MPNRVLRDWTDSIPINGLTVHAERFFTRLIMKVDDTGRFFADTRLLKASLFPLLLDQIREADISRWTAECEKAGLIALYNRSGKPYLEINNFKQRLRIMRSKFPENDGQTSDTRPPEEETKPNPETKQETEPAQAREVVYPFNSEDFKKAWLLWEEYKKQQFNFSYKPIGLQGALKELSELSNGDESIAIKIIIQSIQKGWKGFFKLHTNGKHAASTLTVQQVADQLWGSTQGK